MPRQSPKEFMTGMVSRIREIAIRIFLALQSLFRRLTAPVLEPYSGPLVKPVRTFEDRQQWQGRWDFIMACVGYAVGLGNIWRFPYLCFRNGGGAFLIPYFLVALTSGVPLFFLEIAIGQLLGQGCVTCWKLCPIFKGIGYGIVVLCNWLNIYYIVVLAWSLYYLGMSFSFDLPWANCNNTWNTENCTTGPIYKVNLTCYSDGNCTTMRLTDSVEEFFNRKILKLSSGIDEIGSLNWEMMICLACAWLLNYFIIWKGVKVSGKIVYFTALFPYAMLIVLIIRGFTLPGAMEGAKFYLYPNFSKLLEAQVWMDAGTQIFFSYAVSTGALIAMGSYNRFNNDCYRDTWYICIVNSITSVLSGFCVFTILGFMAHEQGRDVADVVEEGPGLAFMAYPKALSQMPYGAPAWSVLFFFMLVLLGIDSQFVGLEGVFAALLDIFPQLRLGHRPEIAMGSACCVCFLLGLLMCTEGGMFVFQLLDYYSASGFVLLWFCFFECFVIAWVYGGQRFYADITNMIGYRPGNFMLICWAVLAPITSFIIFIVSLVTHTPITYGDDYKYPVWADRLGWFIALSSMFCVPIYFVFHYLRTPGTLCQKFQRAVLPDPSILSETLECRNYDLDSEADPKTENTTHSNTPAGDDGQNEKKQTIPLYPRVASPQLAELEKL